MLGDAAPNEIAAKNGTVPMLCEISNVLYVLDFVSIALAMKSANPNPSIDPMAKITGRIRLMVHS